MRTVHLLVRKSLLLCAAVLLAIMPALAQTQPTLSPELRSSVDDIAQQVLKTTGVPSASVAVVQDGKIAYVQAYGAARLDPQTGCHARDALQHRLHQQAVHGGGRPDAGRGRQALAGRSGVEVRSRADARQQDHHPRAAVAHLGLPGLLAAGLCSAADAEADHGRPDHGSLGAQAA